MENELRDDPQTPMFPTRVSDGDAFFFWKWQREKKGNQQ